MAHTVPHGSHPPQARQCRASRAGRGREHALHSFLPSCGHAHALGRVPALQCAHAISTGSLPVPPLSSPQPPAVLACRSMETRLLASGSGSPAMLTRPGTPRALGHVARAQHDRAVAGEHALAGRRIGPKPKP